MIPDSSIKFFNDTIKESLTLWLRHLFQRTTSRMVIVLTNLTEIANLHMLLNTTYLFCIDTIGLSQWPHIQIDNMTSELCQDYARQHVWRHSKHDVISTYSS
jgi:hypothetical protein